MHGFIDCYQVEVLIIKGTTSKMELYRYSFGRVGTSAISENFTRIIAVAGGGGGKGSEEDGVMWVTIYGGNETDYNINDNVLCMVELH